MLGERLFPDYDDLEKLEYTTMVLKEVKMHLVLSDLFLDFETLSISSLHHSSRRKGNRSLRIQIIASGRVFNEISVKFSVKFLYFHIACIETRNIGVKMQKNSILKLILDPMLLNEIHSVTFHSLLEIESKMNSSKGLTLPVVSVNNLL